MYDNITTILERLNGLESLVRVSSSSWSSGISGSGVTITNIITSNSYSYVDTDSCVLFNGNSAVGILPTSSENKMFIAKNINTTIATITSTSLIDGTTSVPLNPYDSITLLGDGTAWNII